MDFRIAHDDGDSAQTGGLVRAVSAHFLVLTFQCAVLASHESVGSERRCKGALRFGA